MFRKSVFVLIFLHAALGTAFAGETWRFDFGTGTSALADGYVRVTGDAAYSHDLGHGWETQNQQGFDTSVPPDPANPFKYGDRFSLSDFYKEKVTPLLRDGVAHDSEMRERDETNWIKWSRNLLKHAPVNALREEYLADLNAFEEGRHRFINRGRLGTNHFNEMKKSMELMRLIESESPLYYKALQYRGRSLAMQDPIRWGYRTGEAHDAFKELAKAWPENKYAIFYLRNTWEQDDEWHHGDYRQDVAGAPEWAVVLREAYCLILDMTDWWAKNKQQPDGSIGGGWGDDVEIVQFFGAYASISEGAAPKTLNMAEKLIEGMWNNSDLDPEAGFCKGVADTEHSAEWSGDTLGAMVRLKYGNPIWIERAMKTAKLMRNLWMGRTSLGHYHFRANYLGALNIGDGRQANDSYINFRATRPAAMVHWYNQNPLIGELFVNWAEAWVADAMRTDRGKPQGVFPVQVGFDEETLGGVDTPNWFTTTSNPGIVKYHFKQQKYKSYLTSLIMMAHEISKDDKFLEPLRLEAELAQQYKDNPIEAPVAGSQEWAGKILSGAGDAIGTWKAIEKDLSGTEERPVVRFSPEEVAEMAGNVSARVKMRWPNMTTESSATDRVIFPGIGTPYMIMSGAGGGKKGMWNLAAAYSGMKHDAVAYVQAANTRYLKVAAYNFKDETLDAAIIPWLLETGGEYRVAVGVDSDGDGEMDSPEGKVFSMDRWGKRCFVQLAPRQTTIVEFQQTKKGRGGKLMPDLAVVEEEIVYDSGWLEATIHNVGSSAAENITVAFSAISPTGEKEDIGRAKIAHLSWPQDMEPKTMRVGVRFSPQGTARRVQVEIDPEGAIEEITDMNNSAERALAGSQDKLVPSQATKPSPAASKAGGGGRRGR